MRGAIVPVGFFVALVGSSLVAACGDDDAPAPAADAGADSASDAGSSSGADASSSSGDTGTPTGESCLTAIDCPSRQCEPTGEKNYGNVPLGRCVEGGSCAFIPESGTRPEVDPQCSGVQPCLGFVCVPTGIVPGPTGLFACGIPGDVCSNEDGERCCYAECGTDGTCPTIPR